MRLLLPQEGWTDDPSEEARREPAFFNEDRTFPLAALNLVQLASEAAARLKDHAPINPIAHDGYIERLERLS